MPVFGLELQDSTIFAMGTCVSQDSACLRSDSSLVFDTGSNSVCIYVWRCT